MGRLRTTEDKIHMFLLGTAILSIVTLYVRLALSGFSVYEIITYDSTVSLSISILVLIFTFPLSRVVKGIIHIVLVSGMGSQSTFYDFRSWYGMGLLALAVILLVKYGYFKKYIVLKVAILSIYVIVLFEYSSSVINSTVVKFFGIEALIFYSFFMGMIYICYGDRMPISTKRLSVLIRRKDALEIELELISQQIEEFEEAKKKPFDLSNCNLTSDEMEVLQCLVKYQASDVEIGKILRKSETSVKIILKDIYQKLGAKDRTHVMKLCKYNFTERTTSLVP